MCVSSKLIRPSGTLELDEDINAFSNNIQYDDITTIVLKVDE
ncbi:MAG: hypothetical protein RLN83_02210 [Balneola sp.]